MINLQPVIEKVTSLLEENTSQSVTYAALECRLAIEKICYDRLRMAHDYISHAHLKRWLPAAVINTLMSEVDPHVASTRKLAISRNPVGSQDEAPQSDDGFIELGTQVGFDSKRFGNLWNALSGLALHVTLPKSKSDAIPEYGDKTKIEKKVREALRELEKLSKSNLALDAFGPQVSFTCPCGTINKRKLEMLQEGQAVFCVNPDCEESFLVHLQPGNNIMFERRFEQFKCSCGTETAVPIRAFQRMKVDEISQITCAGCQQPNRFMWQMTHAAPKRPSEDESTVTK